MLGKVQRRRDRQDVGILRLDQVRQTGLAHQEGTALIDVAHQVVSPGGQIQRALQRESAGVEDQRVDAAKGGGRLLDHRMDLRLVAHVADHGERMASGGLDFLRRRVDGARQDRMRPVGLCGENDVGTVARGAQRDGMPDPAAAAGDHDGRVPQTHG